MPLRHSLELETKIWVGAQAGLNKAPIPPPEPLSLQVYSPAFNLQPAGAGQGGVSDPDFEGQRTLITKSYKLAAAKISSQTARALILKAFRTVITLSPADSHFLFIPFNYVNQLTRIAEVFPYS